MQRTAVINVVGLCGAALGAHTPRLSSFAKAGKLTVLDPVLPAVTCPAQATYLTGSSPAQHGIVGNGWYDRELAEVHFWKQSNHLVHGTKVWEQLRAIDAKVTCAKLFWWYNMYSSADYSITPRPMYPADGRKVFDIYTQPMALREEIKADLGEFPFHTFWGPAAGVQSPQGSADAVSRWIAESARWIENRHRPTLNLVYLPHLDYNGQRLGPNDPAFARDLKAVDEVAGNLISFLQGRGVRVIVLSEYGLVPVNTPVHLNSVLRQEGWLTVKTELGRELLDPGASKCFAVADHQHAHIYLQDPRASGHVRKLLAAQPGVAAVLDRTEQATCGLDHPRAGDLVAIAAEHAWFTYYYWLDEIRAPDFARTVDIHRKPGYDPVELFLDPALRRPKLRIARRLLQKKLGFRMLMDVIPLDATLVKGSHGARPQQSTHWPVLISDMPALVPDGPVAAADVCGIIREHVLRGRTPI